jgi:hypothetical protein
LDMCPPFPEVRGFVHHFSRILGNFNQSRILVF